MRDCFKTGTFCAAVFYVFIFFSLFRLPTQWVICFAGKRGTTCSSPWDIVLWRPHQAVAAKGAYDRVDGGRALVRGFGERGRQEDGDELQGATRKLSIVRTRTV